jgi:hypothetical protein
MGVAKPPHFTTRRARHSNHAYRHISIYIYPQTCHFPCLNTRPSTFQPSAVTSFAPLPQYSRSRQPSLFLAFAGQNRRIAPSSRRQLRPVQGLKLISQGAAPILLQPVVTLLNIKSCLWSLKGKRTWPVLCDAIPFIISSSLHFVDPAFSIDQKPPAEVLCSREGRRRHFTTRSSRSTCSSSPWGHPLRPTTRPRPAFGG